MVGVPRSKGCSLCVKRRVKCDQDRPACSNCIRYGAECPGYEKGRKFVACKHTVRPRGQNQRGGRHHGTRLDPPSSASATGSTPPAGEDAAAARALARKASRQAPALLRGTPPIPGSLRESAAPFIYNMMGELFVRHPREDMVYTAPWFTSLLGHLGRSAVLDTAMCAYLLQLVGKSGPHQGEVSRSLDLYGQALYSLQRALNHPVEWKSTETLAATMICCVFELSAGTCNPISWMTHAVGVSKLIEHRGHRCFSSPVEKALLRGFRPLITIQCLFSQMDCFLDQPKWQGLSARLSTDATGHGEGRKDISRPVGVLNKYWATYHDSYFILLAKIPPLTRAAYRIREDKRHGITTDPGQVEVLAQQAGRLRSEYRAWLDGAVSEGAITQPVEVPSQDPNSPFVTVVKFANPWVGSVHMGYWATMLIIQEALNQCQAGQERPYDESNQELALNILRSLEHVGHGIMGPYRVGYQLRIAYEFVDLSLQRWVDCALEKYSQHFAALSPETYPRPHGKSSSHLFHDPADARNQAVATASAS